MYTHTQTQTMFCFINIDKKRELNYICSNTCRDPSYCQIHIINKLIAQASRLAVISVCSFLPKFNFLAILRSASSGFYGCYTAVLPSGHRVSHSHTDVLNTMTLKIL